MIQKEFKTKYGLNEEVYHVVHSGMNGFWGVAKDRISRINFGGKAFEQYEVNGSHRAERSLYKTEKEAKEAAKEKAKEHYERNLEIIDEQKLPQIFE
jgi:hypothetical protein